MPRSAVPKKFHVKRLLKTEQLALVFDAPVQVGSYTTKQGTYVAPHKSRRRKKVQVPPHDEHPSQTAESARARIATGAMVQWPAPGRKEPYVGEVVGVRFDGLLEIRVTASSPRTKLKAGKKVFLLPDHVTVLAGKPHVEAPPAPLSNRELTERQLPVGSKVRFRTGVNKDVHVVTAIDDAGNIAINGDNVFRSQGDFEIVPTADAMPDPAPGLEFGVPAGASKADRRAWNQAALQILREKSDGEMTAADRVALARYSGTGGIGDSLNEFHTRPDVASAMWEALERFGFDGGHVWEPSCGTGVFLHTAPASARVVGVELDPTSARIARVLHPDHQLIEGTAESFATQDPREFDAVIGNPPFGLRGGSIAQDKKALGKAEQYFLDTALDKTRAGGPVAMVLPTGVLDASSARSFRARILRKGAFLGAMRLPNAAFADAGTDIATDVVFFRRRDPAVAQALALLDDQAMERLGAWDSEFVSGGYFDGRGASNILGRVEPGWRAKAGLGQDIAVAGSMEGVATAIAGFEPEPVAEITMAEVLGAAGEDELLRERMRRAAALRPYEVAQVGDTKMVDGVLYVLQGDPPRWHRASLDDAGEPEAVTQARELGQRIAALQHGEGDRAVAVEALSAWVEQHGIPAQHAALTAAASVDPDLLRVLAAVRADGSYSDLLAGRDADAHASIEAVAERLSLAGGFTPADLAREAGGDPDAVADLLHASSRYSHDPATGRWYTSDIYLTGDLWAKWDGVRAALAQSDLPATLRAKYEAQGGTLEKAIAPKMLEDVEISVNDGFIPPATLQAWQQAKVDAWVAASPGSGWKPDPVSITYDGTLYHIRGGLDQDSELLANYLNRTGVKKDDRPLIEAMNKQFREWVLASEHREAMEDHYNRTHTGFIPERFSDVPIEVPGLNPEFDVNAYHWPSLRWALARGKGIVAADVGLGKSGRALILNKLLKLHGLAKKPLIVVPKSVLANWFAEVENWFPGAKVLVIGETYKDGKAKEDTKAVRDQKLHDLAQNDYDFVLMSEPAWNELDLNPINKKELVDEDFWTRRAEALGQAGDKRIRKIREAHEQAMAKRDFEKRTEAIYFEDLGVDALILDEAHRVKNLFSARSRWGESPRFLGGSGESNRALDTLLKGAWLRQQMGGKNIFFLTATPTKNSPLEVYSMLSHIAPEAFEAMGIRNSEDFLDRFCVFEQRQILGVNGEIADALVTVGFKNLDELREVMRRYIDRTTAVDVGLKLPDRDDREHVVEMTNKQKAVYEELRELAEDTSGKKDSGEAHIFSIMDKMGKASMDLELLDPGKFKGQDSPKYLEVAQHAAAGAKEGGQVIFADHVDSHEKIAAALAEQGIERKRIGILNAQAAPSSSKRQSIADAYNAGKLDVVIGNTAVMGEGLNLQKRTSDIHHLDLPWEPASLQQRNGRGLRQGNRNEAVRIHRYLAKGSFDGYRYQTLAAKGDWMDQLWNGGANLQNLSLASLDREEMLVMLAADPDKARAAIANKRGEAEVRALAAARQSAAERFLRYRRLGGSLAALKDQQGRVAQRLREQIAAERTRLEADQHWSAKDALDAPDTVVVDPQRGAVYRVGDGVRMMLDSGSPIVGQKGDGVYVVDALDADAGTLTMRPFGGNAGSVEVPVDKLRGSQVVAVDHDEDRSARSSKAVFEGVARAARAVVRHNVNIEMEHVERAVEEAARSVVGKDKNWHATPQGRARLWSAVHTAAQSTGLAEKDAQRVTERAQLAQLLQTHGRVGEKAKYRDIVRLPPAVQMEHADVLNRVVRDMIAGAEITGTDPIGFVDEAGHGRAVENYELRTAAAKWRLMLGTKEDREKAIAAWAATERSRTYKMAAPPSGPRQRARPERLNVQYSYDNDSWATKPENPWTKRLRSIFGDEALAEATAQLRTQAESAAVTADSPAEKIAAYLPAVPATYWGTMEWPKAWLHDIAKAAQQAGALDTPLRTLLPGTVPTAVLGTPANTQPANLYGALLNLARVSEDNELIAMLEQESDTEAA
jgi:predicted RNA methylase